MLLRFTVLVFLLAYAPCLMAQDIASASLRWTCNQTTNLRDGSTSGYSCVFITRGATGVTWLQRSGQIATQFTVTSTEGTWNSVTQEGQFTYHLSRDGKTGKLVVERTASGIALTLDFSESGDTNIKQRFHASEVAPEL
jgi:hypothetical protein